MNDPRETLNRIRKQANAATDGPWEADGLEGTITSKTDGLVTDPQGPYLVVDGITRWAESDAEFIATARTNVPRLVDALEKVLELHSPLTGRPSWDGDIRCNGCYDPYYDVYEPYPCELVKAITTALEGETR